MRVLQPSARRKRVACVIQAAVLLAGCVPTAQRDPDAGGSPPGADGILRAGSGTTAAGEGGQGAAASPSDTGGTGAAASSTDGGADVPRDGGVVSCPMPCALPAPICDPDTLTCVQCLGQGDCSSPSASRCNPATRACESCRPNNVTDCDGIVVDGQAREVCIGGLCLGCIKDTDCGSEASVCENNLCTACATAMQCDHIADRPMCIGGRCIECEETSDCADVAKHGVCDVRGGACASELPGVTPLCGTCVSNDQCDEGVCARMPTDPSTDDYRCMPLADPSTACDATARQFRVYSGTTDVAGKSVTACVPAMLDCGLLSRQDTTCGADGSCGNGAMCEGTCVIACEVDRDCGERLFCKAGAGGEYCRP